MACHSEYSVSQCLCHERCYFQFQFYFSINQTAVQFHVEVESVTNQTTHNQYTNRTINK